jgi:proline iminopeptidase
MAPDQFTCSEQMLPVGDGHKLYLQEWGNKAARQTFLFLHGGPGGECNDGHKLLFNGQRDHVIFFDQRGAGKSTPSGSLKSNTTDKLIADIEAILKEFKIETVMLVGGSWGSTLALAYALAHPERVSAMVLRGIFTGSQTEIDHLLKGAFRTFYPDVWEVFMERTPPAHRTNPAAYLNQCATSGDLAAVAAYAYYEMEGSIISLDDRHRPTDRATFSPNGVRIELSYLQNRCFMPDRYILNNARKLTMPIWLVQGRYDMICPPITAYELHKRLPNSELIFTIAGHSSSDRGTFDTMRSIIGSLGH